MSFNTRGPERRNEDVQRGDGRENIRGGSKEEESQAPGPWMSPTVSALSLVLGTLLGCSGLRFTSPDGPPAPGAVCCRGFLPVGRSLG